MFLECRVEISRFAEKRIKKLPKRIQVALMLWVETIELQGVWKMRNLKGYHDESLKGQRQGQRSSRLSRSYRVIYEEKDLGQILVIFVLEVNKHEY